MHYTVYEIVNKINEKVYIGKHQTEDIDDSYMGSGKVLHKAYEKYGIENFEKKILFVFDNEEDMNRKEAELVTEEFCLRSDTYNLCPGGKGGWGYINSISKTSPNNFENSEIQTKARLLALESRRLKFSTGDRNLTYRLKLSNSLLGNKNTLGYKHSEDAKKKIGEKNSARQMGKGNSQFGSIWINNGEVAKKIRSHECIPEGWSRGRKI